MGLYAGEDVFGDDVYQFEETDVVQGGADGIDNKPLKDLANRTIWLKNRMGRIMNLVDERVINANGQIKKDDSGYMITAISSSVLTLALDSTDSFTKGAIIPISSFCSAAAVIKITPSAGQYFFDADGNRSVLYMHHKEHLFLVAADGHWKILNAIGNFYTAGEETKSRKILRNTVPAIGQLLNRDRYPRLWEYVQSLDFGHEVISESLRATNTLLYGACYTTGDGVSTFRVPDERAMHERMLDLGRGVDLARAHNYAGGYAPDDVKSHDHVQTVYQAVRDGGDIPVGFSSVTSNRTGNYKTQKTGAAENTVKTIGKYFLIKY